MKTPQTLSRANKVASIIGGYVLGAIGWFMVVYIVSGLARYPDDIPRYSPGRVLAVLFPAFLCVGWSYFAAKNVAPIKAIWPTVVTAGLILFSGIPFLLSSQGGLRDLSFEGCILVFVCMPSYLLGGLFWERRRQTKMSLETPQRDAER